jgi:hypothetical protein
MSGETASGKQPDQPHDGGDRLCQKHLPDGPKFCAVAP